VVEGDAAAAQGVDVEGAALVVALLLVLVEGDLDGVDLVGGEVAALELVDAGAVADGPSSSMATDSPPSARSRVAVRPRR
jgi:hypothetical protein